MSSLMEQVSSSSVISLVSRLFSSQYCISRITDSRLRDVIVGDGSTVDGADLHDSLLGSQVLVRGVKGRLSVADHSEVSGDS